MQQVYEMKVIVLTRGDLTETVRMFFSEPPTLAAMFD